MNFHWVLLSNEVAVLEKEKMSARALAGYCSTEGGRPHLVQTYATIPASGQEVFLEKGTEAEARHPSQR